jgi:hypothetical protein
MGGGRGIRQKERQSQRQKEKRGGKHEVEGGRERREYRNWYLLVYILEAMRK